MKGDRFGTPGLSLTEIVSKEMGLLSSKCGPSTSGGDSVSSKRNDPEKPEEGNTQALLKDFCPCTNTTEEG